MASPSPTLKPIKVVVPGSTSNVGPGFDAFSIALDLPMKVSWAPATKPPLAEKEHWNPPPFPSV